MALTYNACQNTDGTLVEGGTLSENCTEFVGIQTTSFKVMQLEFCNVRTKKYRYAVPTCDMAEKKLYCFNGLFFKYKYT